MPLITSDLIKLVNEMYYARNGSFTLLETNSDSYTCTTVLIKDWDRDLV